MNDPHVEALLYRVRHNESVDYTNASPLQHEEADFRIRIEDGSVRVDMKAHHPSEEAARSVVDSFLRAWEFSAALDLGPGELQFEFESARIVDRNPSPGVQYIRPLNVHSSVSFGPCQLLVERRQYPAPPSGIKRNGDVDLMFDRFLKFRRNESPLSEAAYFCFTVLTIRGGGLKAVAHHFGISQKVLVTLSTLASTKGGDEARKAAGAKQPHTPAERRWLEEAMKRMIIRAAEVACDPTAYYQQITMADLPSLTPDRT